jgi:glycosyltransferase involved in cell wall biosynthesis
MLMWSHIGGGQLFADVQDQARGLLSDRSNVTYEFTGDLANNEVRDFLRSGTADLIVNVSADEGIPVSIMEAMSFGIPAVATDVGGVRELVSQPHGLLLPANPSEHEIAIALAGFAPQAKSERVRRAARAVIEKHYNAETNYPAFLRDIGAI